MFLIFNGLTSISYCNFIQNPPHYLYFFSDLMNAVMFVKKGGCCLQSYYSSVLFACVYMNICKVAIAIVKSCCYFDMLRVIGMNHGLFPRFILKYYRS